nr:hypothetical protein [uncultured bacterium]
MISFNISVLAQVFCIEINLHKRAFTYSEQVTKAICASMARNAEKRDPIVTLLCSIPICRTVLR